ncbi:MARVEL domain-containing protein 3 [Alligator mississippiensis]|nr:MARVEL domain-containing protein 3 [Alligator mississippiensis]
MSQKDRPHQDKPYRYHESHGYDRYTTERRTKEPYPSHGRSAKEARSTQHSRPSTLCSDPYKKNAVSTHGYVSSPPHFYPHKQTFSEKCANICSTRGILKFVEITVGILVLICVAAAQAAISGYSSMGGLGMGSFSLDTAYSPFEGYELKEVRDLDMQFSQMRAPCVYGGIAFSLTMAALTLLFLVIGAKPIHRLSMPLLMAECAFDILAGIAYTAAVGLYLHFVIQVNTTDVCKKRERLYARRGYTSMNCEVQGGDAAVAVFGIVAACLYFPSSVICARTIRTVRNFRRHQTQPQYSPESSYKERGHPKANRSPESTRSMQAVATLV